MILRIKFMMKRFTLSIFVLFVWYLSAVSSVVAATTAQYAGNEWRAYGGDSGGTRYSTLSQINRRNVQKLKSAWTFHTGEGISESSTAINTGSPAYSGRPTFQCTPLMIDGILYVTTSSSRVIALDAEDGRKLWEFDAQAGKAGKRKLHQHRGVSYWEGTGADGKKARLIIFASTDARLFALDPVTGKPAPGFGKEGSIDLREGIADNYPNLNYDVTSPPAIYKNLIIIGARVPEEVAKGPSGDVRAFDVRTGKLVWRFHTVPHPGEAGHESWTDDSWKERTGANAWSIISVDAARSMVFLPLGSASHDFYGGERKGNNLFANSIVALNADTGKLIWHYQVVHHDIWDFDVPAQPNLVTVIHQGRLVPAVAQMTKMGFTYVLDRLTGKPLFPVEERAVAASSVPGEQAATTQPFPLKPAPLSNIKAITRDEINDLTPEIKRQCTELYDQAVSANIFTPLLLDKWTLMRPNRLGGATWSGASFDPTSGYLFVNANEMAQMIKVTAQPAGAPLPYERDNKTITFAADNKIPCQRPPWGTLNAINLNTGQIAWRVPLGFNETLAKRGLTNTGTWSLGGSIATAGHLVFIAGTNDSRFRAFDSSSGKELWATSLPAPGHATPMTYQGKRSGKQFVVIAAGGGGNLGSKTSDALEAYALP